MKGKLKFILPVPILLVVLVRGLHDRSGTRSRPWRQAEDRRARCVALDGPFIVNLAGGRYGKISVVAAALDGAARRRPPGCRSTLPRGLRDPRDHHRRADRDPAGALINRAARDAAARARCSSGSRSTTDEPVTQVLITDLAVQ